MIFGDLLFSGDSAGLSYGHCYGNHIAWVQVAAQNTWYNIADADIADGQLHDVAHDGNGMLTIAPAGKCLVTWSLCFQDDKANDHLEVGVEVSSSGAADPAGQGHSENKFAGQEEHLGSSAILDLAAGATLQLAIRTTDAAPAPTIDVQAINLCAVMLERA